MTIDEPELAPARPGEPSGMFAARLKMLERVAPLLRDLVATEHRIIVESDRRPRPAAGLQTDVLVEVGDLRLRLLFVPTASDPFGDELLVEKVAHYLLEVADTDAVGIVADDDRLTCWLFTVYDAHRPQRQLPKPEPLRSAVDAFLTSNSLALELPDLRAALPLPTMDELAVHLNQEVEIAFRAVAGSHARIPEKVAAINSITDADKAHIAKALAQLMRGGQPTVSGLFHEQGESS